MSGRSQCFTASYDSTTKIISIGLCLFLGLTALLLKSALFIAIAAFLVLLAYAYSPKRYVVSHRSVTVQRLAGNLVIPLDGAREARLATAVDFKGAIRLWGNGGLFGYYGLFRTSRLRKCSWYMTSRRNAVVVVTDQRTALFSPDDVQGFLAAIQANTRISAATQGNAPSDTAPGSFTGILIGAAAASLVLAVVALSITYSPGLPSYTLTSASLTIHDRFYPVTVNAAAVDLDGVRVVDFAVDRDWRPVKRVNGFANSHYQSGWFEVASGQKIRMYRASGNRLVLLPPKRAGNAVLIEVEHPEEFVREIRRQWGTAQ